MSLQVESNYFTHFDDIQPTASKPSATSVARVLLPHPSQVIALSLPLAARLGRCTYLPLSFCIASLLTPHAAEWVEMGDAIARNIGKDVRGEW